MGMTVWIDGWQMQCCGEPFRLGSQVAWTLGAADPDWLEAMLGALQTVDAVEEHHGGVPEDTVPTRGTVTHIAAVHCRYAPRSGSESRTLYPVAGSGFSQTSIRRTGGPLIAVTSDSSGTSCNSNPDSAR
jgi:hypothetical protein